VGYAYWTPGSRLCAKKRSRRTSWLGKEEDVATETFQSNPRVKVPTGRVEGRQPEASLAWS